ncbi:hypothetical protein J6590_006367 [Homalodisca vitripennis]|nr:hypothetical protein J6590_006367 [Homalodisca vitripennis]
MEFPRLVLQQGVDGKGILSSGEMCTPLMAIKLEPISISNMVKLKGCEVTTQSIVFRKPSHVVLWVQNYITHRGRSCPYSCCSLASARVNVNGITATDFSCNEAYVSMNVFPHGGAPRLNYHCPLPLPPLLPPWPPSYHSSRAEGSGKCVQYTRGFHPSRGGKYRYLSITYYQNNVVTWYHVPLTPLRYWFLSNVIPEKRYQNWSVPSCLHDNSLGCYSNAKSFRPRVTEITGCYWQNVILVTVRYIPPISTSQCGWVQEYRAWQVISCVSVLQVWGQRSYMCLRVYYTRRISTSSWVTNDPLALAENIQLGVNRKAPARFDTVFIFLSSLETYYCLPGSVRVTAAIDASLTITANSPLHLKSTGRSGRTKRSLYCTDCHRFAGKATFLPIDLVTPEIKWHVASYREVTAKRRAGEDIAEHSTPKMTAESRCSHTAGRPPSRALGPSAPPPPHTLHCLCSVLVEPVNIQHIYNIRLHSYPVIVQSVFISLI